MQQVKSNTSADKVDLSLKKIRLFSQHLRNQMKGHSRLRYSPQESDRKIGLRIPSNMTKKVRNGAWENWADGFNAASKNWSATASSRVKIALGQGQSHAQHLQGKWSASAFRITFDFNPHFIASSGKLNNLNSRWLLSYTKIEHR